MWQSYAHSSHAGSHPYFVYTPTGYRVGTPVPLIVMLHGCAQTALDFATSTGMNVLADRYGFLVAYPQQIRSGNSTCCWNWFKSTHQTRGRGEPAMIASMVRDIEQKRERWTIDSRRIYVAGLSAGAAMTAILGATYPDMFAAIGLHSGLAYRAATNMFDGLRAMRRGGPDPLKLGMEAYKAMGPVARVMPSIVFHGTGDSVVDPINGEGVVRQWLQTNRLASQGTIDARFEEPSRTETGRVQNGYAYSVHRWIDGQGQEVQAYWRVEGMGHGWAGGSPGGSFTHPLEPNASLAMYQFFMQHPMKIERID